MKRLEVLRLIRGDGSITGPVNAHYNKLINLRDPTEPSDAVTKRYCDDGLRSKINLEGDVMQGDLDLDWNNLTSVRFPLANYDAVNKMYVQTLITGNEADLDIIIHISQVLIRNLVSDNRYLKNYLIPLENSLNLIKTMHYDCTIIFNNHVNKPVLEMIKNCPFYLDLKVNIISIIEKLNRTDFEVLIQAYNLAIVDIHERSVIKKYKKFIREKTEKLDEIIQENSEFKLLKSKNELILDLGFLHFIERFLRILLLNKIERPSPEDPWVRPEVIMN